MRSLLVLILVALATASCRTASFKNRALQSPRPVPAMALHDQRGGTFQFNEQRGRVVLVFFGYTRCPDVCPLTLGTFKTVEGMLGAQADRARFVFVTVDPEVDTPEFLDRYLRLFSPNFIGLTGSPEELQPVYEFFGAAFQKVDVPKSALGYLMAHSTNTAVIDRQGRWRLNVRHDARPADIADDIRTLLRTR